MAAGGGDKRAAPDGTLTRESEVGEEVVSVTRETAVGASSRPDSLLVRGDFVGRYVVLDTIGEGGMGVVYKAYDPDLDRAVAVKILPDRRSGPHRLLTEARALARLSHPNVVSVYDVGSFGADVFVAMELVAGRTLGSWLDDTKPGPEQIIEVFCAAGRGLAGAHAAGLVHRDFKPSNVMVGDDGRVRVLDFGLASAVTEGNELVAGTPAYMAPEQFGGEADARADQFAFCVALYEALCGARPYEITAVRDAGAGDGSLGEPSRGWSRVSARVRRILERGLAADRARRFESMTQLLSELAGPPGRRTAIAVGSGAVMVLVAAGLLAVAARGHSPSPSCDAPARLGQAWSDEVAADIERAFRASGLTSAGETFERVEAQLSRYAEAWDAAHREACEATHVRGTQSEELLDRRMYCLNGALDDLAALTAQLSAEPDIDRAIAAVYRLPDITQCAQAEWVGGSALPTDPDVRARVRALRARASEVDALLAMGKVVEAVAIAEQLVIDAEDVDYPPLQAEVLFRRGQARATADERVAGATDLLEAVALASRERLDTLVAEGYLKALDTLLDDNRTDELLAVAPFAAATLARGGGDSSKHIAELEAVIAKTHLRRRDFTQARIYATAAMGLYAVQSGDARRGIATVTNTLGNVESRAGNLDAARAHYEHARDIMLDMYGPDHPDIATMENNLGNLAFVNEDLAGARAHYEASLRIKEARLPADSPKIAGTLGNLASVIAAQGDYAGAASMFERAVVALENKIGPDHPQLVHTLVAWGEVLIQSGDPSGRAQLERALRIAVAAHGADSEIAAEVESTLRSVGLEPP